MLKAYSHHPNSVINIIKMWSKHATHKLIQIFHRSFDPDCGNIFSDANDSALSETRKTSRKTVKSMLMTMVICHVKSIF